MCHLPWHSPELSMKPKLQDVQVIESEHVVQLPGQSALELITIIFVLGH